MAKGGNKTFKKYVKAVRIAQQAALKQTAFFFQNEIDPFVPIASGALRKTGRVEVKKGEVFIAYGEGLKYTKVQYFDELDHLGTRGKYRSMGSTKRVYARTYTKLKREGRLVPSMALWFDAVLESKKTQLEGAFIYAKTFRKESARRNK